MNITTVEELQSKIDKDLAWRKKELSEIKFLIDRSTEGTLPINLRIGIVIIYAHWEGFIKNGGDWYVNFLKQKGLKFSELRENFIALALRGNFKACGTTEKTSIHHSIVKILINGLDDIAPIPYEKAIKTNSNLDYETFHEIVFTLGLDDKNFELRKNLINEVLLEQRNTIAHGQRYMVERTDFDVLYEKIIPLLEQYKFEILNSAQNELYKRNNPV